MFRVSASLRRGAFTSTAVLLLSAQVAEAQQGQTRSNASEPGTGEIMADVLVARPIGAAMTAIGTAAFVVTLPFSILGGDVAEAGQKLVVGPGKETFVRCLGCKKSGWRGDYDQ